MEKVARAICEAHGLRQWDELTADGQLSYRSQARAAIAAHNSAEPGLLPTPSPVEHSVAILVADKWQRRAEAAEAKLAEAVEALRKLQRSCIDAPVGAGDGQTYVVIAPSAAVLQETSATLAKLEPET
jgi:hypothetical protein